jgi:hypothetical protein
MIEIDREHPDHKRRQHMLRMYRDLYAGGLDFKQHASEYLLRRQKEPLDVFGERLQRVFYQNYIGSIVDWYASTLFRREPSIQFEGGLEAGKNFLSEFVDNCDRRGTRLTDFFRRCLIDMLIAGETHILVDFPRIARVPSNRAEEDATGLSRAYVVQYQSEDLINWCADECGDYEWIVLRQKVRRQPRVESPDVIEETFWRYYDRSEFRVYRRVEGENSTGIVLVDGGLHAFSREQRVPLLTMQVSEGLWLMNKAAHLQLEHFNKSNALSWAITMGLFAMPVIYSDREWNQIVGESYYIQLGPTDRFGWTEPDGKVYQIAASNLESLKEEIYRVCYLTQASGEMVSGHAQSALSKQMDFAITQEVLRTYSSVVKESIRQLLNAISSARQDGVLIAVSGLDEVDISDFSTDLKDAKDLLAVGIESATLKRQVYQRLALKYLNDARQDLKDQIAREINTQFSM